jgi:subtilisin family serine protease
MRFVRFLSPLIVLVLVIASASMAGQFAPGLESYLVEKHAGEPLRALLVLTDQVDVQGMDLDMHYQKTDLATRHFRVVTALQEKAKNTQGPLLVDLESRLGKGINGYQSYWLINAVMVTGDVEVVRQVAARADVELAEVDLVPELIQPTRVEQSGKSIQAIGIAPGIVSVGARRVWDELGIRGEGALIGSLDTGVDGNHPALSNRWRGTHAPWNECWLDVLGSGTTFPVDNGSHGTHTTGTMTGIAPNDTIGVAPAAEWIATNAIDQGAGGGFDNDILNCLQFFTDPDGDPGTTDDVPDVVQNSWGVHEGFTGYVDCDSRWWNAIDACEAAGVALCWSAGNEGSSSQTLRSPADRATTLYNCFSVGATQYYSPFNIWSSSSRGPAGPNCGPQEYRMKPEISAPGVDIYSSVPGGGYQGGWNGTSMAGPHVAGVMALMRSANPNVDVITLKQVLMTTAVDLGQSGEDTAYGHGFLDAYEAVLAVMGGFGWVEGDVQDRATSQPIAGAMVTAEGQVQFAVTDADGSYRLALPVGQATLHVEAFGYADPQEAVTVVENVTTYLDFDLTALPTATLSGTVHLTGYLPPDQAPADGCIVRIADTPLSTVTTGADGRFAFTLPVGADYLVQASLGSLGANSQTVPLSGDLDFDLYLAGITTEGFETGDFSGNPWILNGNDNWYVQSSEVHSGNHAARSGDLGDNQVSHMAVTVDCGAGGEVSFWYKVSSEATYDFLKFYVDDGLKVDWSGEQGWAEYTTTVSGGDHTFRWTYEKDYSVSNGSDSGWIDDIQFPGGASPVPVAVAAPWFLDGGVLESGQQLTLPLLVMNQGSQPLDFTAGSGAGWVTVIDPAAVVGANSYHLCQVTLDATGLLSGMHSAWVDIDSNDPANPQIDVPVELEVTPDASSVAEVPLAFALLGAVPNPFNPQTTIRFTLPVEGFTNLHLYDVRGRLVRALVHELRPGGLNEAIWNGRDQQGRAVASGTYFARLQFDNWTSVKNLVLVR